MRYIYNARVTLPHDPIYLWDDDISAAFRRVKYHPDIAGAFAYADCGTLYIPVGLTFGSVTSPGSYETLGQARAVISTHRSFMTPDNLHLLTKHRTFLDMISFSSPPADEPARARSDASNPGIDITNGHHLTTPHFLYVDDTLMAGPLTSIKLAIVVSLEACFITFGDIDPSRSCPINLEKFSKSPCATIRTQLGLTVDTHALLVAYPMAKLQALREDLAPFHNHRRQVPFAQCLSLLGTLEHAARYILWLRHVCQNIRGAVNIQLSTMAVDLHACDAYITSFSHARHITDPRTRRHHMSYHEQRLARQAFLQAPPINITRDMKLDFLLLHTAVRHPLLWSTPIAYIIPRSPEFIAYGDSCLAGAGGYSTDLAYWWYIPWPLQVQSRFLAVLPDHLSINTLEYAAIVINYIIASSILGRYNIVAGDDRLATPPPITHPSLRIYTDNTTAMSWTTSAAASSSNTSRSLSRFLAAQLLLNRIGLEAKHVAGDKNVIADAISRFAHESNSDTLFSSLQVHHPPLHGCRRYHLQPELHSALMSILLGICDAVQLLSAMRAPRAVG